MSKRMYFNDPVQALYMSKHFGVKFKDEDYYSLVDSSICVTLENYDVKFYVSKESESIFDLKEGDMNLKGHLAYLREKQLEFLGIAGLYEPVNPAHKIIMRDNKHFFHAKIENNND